jgi:Uma2 family endonuclease
MPDDGRVYELVNGELKEVAVSKESSRVGARVCRELVAHCDTHAAGWVYGLDMGFRCFAGEPDRVRKADVAYVSLARMPAETYQDEGYCSVVPDLVVEVTSPNDYASEVAEKRDEWLAAGVRTVWIIEPETRTVHVHRADGSYAFLRTGDTLTAPDLLPGFAVPVANLFKMPGPAKA